jgi:hypothetical protein
VAEEPGEDPKGTSFFSSFAYVFGFFFALALLAWVGACLLRSFR